MSGSVAGRAHFYLCPFSFAADMETLHTLPMAAVLLWVKEENPFPGDSGTGENGPQEGEVYQMAWGQGVVPLLG